MLNKNLFPFLKTINKKPKAYSRYTTPDLWCTPYIAKQMLSYHLNQETDLASRKTAFIDRSVIWMAKYFRINAQTKICDFGCGPGLYTTRFALLGAQVTGIDFSKTSINYAKATAKQHKLEINYVLQNYLAFSSMKKFDLITMIYCDYCALSPKQRRQLLKIFFNLLNDNGRVFFDVSSMAYFAAKKATATLEYSAGKGFWSAKPYFVFANAFKYDDECLLLDKFTIVEEKRIRESYNWLQCFSKKTIADELQQNNFKVIDCFANVTGESYEKNSPEMAIVAKKQTKF
ncbi:MAG: class I SAM-dependent methyltransferase [Gammaproteobacteria bacterium]|nr:class I SAM-dependent methyltransferase [Gammaproteobacteria bacterium]